MIKKLTLTSFLTVILFLFCFYFYEKTDLLNIKLSWDEAGYYKASQKGFINNYLSKDSINFIEFVKIAKNKVSIFKNSSLENNINTKPEEDDQFILRHFHPVAPTYLWGLFTKDDVNINLKNIRISNIIVLTLIPFVS